VVAIIKAIPTEYAGSMFRSRLEARWASFFDLCGWRWTYEPDDMDGYIPDFKLWFRTPLLVEVKPINWDESERDESILEEARLKFINAGISGEALILGSRICIEDVNGAQLAHQRIGAIMDIDHDTDEASPWGPAFAFICRMCGRRSLASEDLSWRCRVRSCYDDANPVWNLGRWDADADFRRAGSEVQWKPR
jgi:hypothetical protein